jgi:trk system potassium uptake protein TrkH
VPNVGETMSLFGKTVMLILIEIGGLSFLTLTIFFMVAFKVKLGISESFLMRESLGQGSLKNLENLIIKIVKITLIIQLIGAIISAFIIYFSSEMKFSFLKSLGLGVFHSISAFNNAGFDVLGTSESLIIYHNNIPLNIVTMLLIIIGGLGFVVLIDMFEQKKFSKLSLHSKITLTTTITLIIFGTILLSVLCGMI